MNEIAPFVYETKNALDKAFCEDIISRFEKDERKGLGLESGYTGGLKKSTDLRIGRLPEWEDIDSEFCKATGRIVDHLISTHEGFENEVRDSGYQIQKTKPGEGFKPHCDGGYAFTKDRLAAVIWYLNDSDGPTRFNDLGVEVLPEAGKQIVFPAFWTHLHEGVPPTQNKYIVTTFIVLCDDEGVN